MALFEVTAPSKAWMTDVRGCLVNGCHMDRNASGWRGRTVAFRANTVPDTSREHLVETGTLATRRAAGRG